MNQSDLVEKLDAMRSAAGIREIDVMTRLFGVTFDREIAACETNANRIVDEYLRVHGHRVGSPVINDGRKLSRFVTVNPEVLRKWRG